jgi:hypothetical protein
MDEARNQGVMGLCTSCCKGAGVLPRSSARAAHRPWRSLLAAMEQRAGKVATKGEQGRRYGEELLRLLFWGGVPSIGGRGPDMGGAPAGNPTHAAKAATKGKGLGTQGAGDVAQGACDSSPEQGVGHGRRRLTSSSSNQGSALRHGWSRRARVGSWQVELGQGDAPAPMEESSATWVPGGRSSPQGRLAAMGGEEAPNAQP